MKFSTWDNFNPKEHKNTTIVIADDLPLHKKVRMKRLIEGLSQQKLAEILGLEYAPRVCTLESGKVPPLYVERIEQYLYEEDYSNGELVK
ncbi:MULTISPECIES: hypothetical protein [Bacillus]|uniref:XRE family transcriptional regulator n=2 Tax=Bacillus cereus group TaxID=86661 RepID=A0A164L2A1_BACCE|nr:MULTISPECIES: hypothetical protein [Bacillus]KZD53963.1 hypothetical protein B4088_5725 [Bacillus cereus]TSI05001.1 XRE family transcriptional regulator [Bacillus sp. HY001]